MSKPIYQATVKSTLEVITVYKKSNGNYYDYDNMGENMPPQAFKSGKKEFKEDELTNITVKS